MDTKSGNMEQKRNFFGRSQDDQNNITGGMGSESVEKYSLGEFVLSVDAPIMQVGRQNDISFGSEDQTFDSKADGSDESGPVLTEYWRPTGKLSVGRSRSGFPDCKYDHVVQLLVRKNKHTREALDITDNYNITLTVTYNGNNDGSFQMPDYQCKRLKTETQCGVNRSMVGVVGFLFRFHEPNTKYKITCTLLTTPPKRGRKANISRKTNARKKLSEISIMLETGEKSKWKSVKPSEKTEVRKIIPPSFALEPASLSKTSAELVERSVSVVNQLQSFRNDGKWDDFDKLSSDLLLKLSDIDSQIIIKLEQSVGALYRKDFEGSLKFIDESFELIPQAINVPFLAGRGYGYRVGVARRQKNLGEAVSLLHLAEQNNRACSINLDTSNIAYEKASVLLDFIGLSPQKSLKQVREALGNLEKCIDVCMKLEIEDNDLSRFAFIKIAMLLLDCRTDASRERVLSDEFIKKSQECLIRLETKYWSEIAEGAKVQFYLASSDLQYRKGNFMEAERFACLARDMAKDLGFTTEISLAQERLDHSRVFTIGGRTGNDFRPFTSSFVSASEGENGDVSSSGSESDWLKTLE